MQVARMVEQWAGLSRESLVAAVVSAVRQPPADPTRLWQAVRADPVLAATVRGVLSGVLRDKAGTRDEVFWTYRVNTVRAALTAPEPVVTAPVVTELENTRQPEARSIAVAAPDLVPITPPRAAVRKPAGPPVPAIPFQAPLY